MTVNPDSNNTWKVISVNKRRNETTVRIIDREGKTQTLSLNKYTYINFKKDGNKITRQDSLIITKKGKSIYKIGKIVDDGFGKSITAKVYPYYQKEELLTISDQINLNLLVKEITTIEEYQYVRNLSQFHYLGKDNLWGRKLFLIVKPKNQCQYPPILGYIMLTSPSLLSRQRDLLLNWTDKEDRQKNIDRVVRITRVVVHPEFRGIGLGRLLVQHSILYCKEYWNVAGLKPWLLETIAEMSRYHPIFEKAGMFQFGETKGMLDIQYKPKNKMISGQGKGFYRASIDRMKTRFLEPKPYYYYPIHPQIKMLTSGKMVSSGIINEIQRFKTPNIQIHNLTIIYERKASWHEPLDVYQDWANYNREAARAYNIFKQYLLCLQTARNDQIIRKDIQVIFKKLSEEDGTRIRPFIEGVEKTIVRLNTLIGRPFHESNDLLSSVEVEIDRYKDQIEKAIQIQPEIENVIGGAIQKIEKLTVNNKVCQRIHNLSMLRHNLIELRRIYNLGALTTKEEDVRKAFGVSPDFKTMVFQDFNIDIPAGSIVLIVGPSGSGKSTLLSAIAGKNIIYNGGILPNDIKNHVGVLDLQFDSTKSIIELIHEDTKNSINILNTVGLSEAALYLKRRDELSHGQKYRAATALLLNSGKPIWLADEFCAFLDPLTAVILSKGIRQIVKERGATFIAAVSNEDNVLKGLQPDIIIRINAGRNISPNPKHIFLGKNITTERIFIELNNVKSKKKIKDPRIGRFLIKLGLIENFDNYQSYPVIDLRIKRAFLKNRKSFNKYLCTILWEKDLISHRLLTLWGQYDQKSNEEDFINKLLIGNTPWPIKFTRTQIKRRITLLREIVLHEEIIIK
jgi:ABC-type phosphate/phosphonate transport system ATPase subunit